MSKETNKNIIAMTDLPKSCDKCIYHVTKFYHPFWSKEKPNTKGLYCQLLKNCEVLELNIDDETTKRKDCPIKKLDENLEQKNKKLKQQRAEKDEKLNKLRHEICEKIRKCSQNVSVYKEGLGLTDCYAIEEIVLQEIENGEE